MQILITTAIAVATMLAYAVPGYLTVRCKLIRAESISAFSVLLMYVCQPMLTITSFLNATYTLDFFWKMIVAFVLAGVLQLGVILIAHFCLKKHYDKDIKYRVATVATAFGNCGFMGVPLLQAIMPEAVRNNAVVLSVMFLFGLNLIGWTFASYLISGDKKFISVNNIDLFMLVITDIIATDSEAIVLGNRVDIAEKAFLVKGNRIKRIK